MKNTYGFYALAAMALSGGGMGSYTDDDDTGGDVDGYKHGHGINVITPEQKAERERIQKERSYRKGGLRKFSFGGHDIWAMNFKNAERKAKNLGIVYVDVELPPFDELDDDGNYIGPKI